MEKFHQLRIEKVLTTFHIKEKTNCLQLDELITAGGSVSDFEEATLDAALDRYNRLSRGWNEEELKMQFIRSIIIGRHHQELILMRNSI
jgi:hypothetical protein